MTGKTNLYEVNYTAPAGSFDNTLNVGFRGRPDDITEGNHTCDIEYQYFVDGATTPDLAQNITAAVQDYRPTTDAQAPSLLYERPVGPAQSSSGTVSVRLGQLPSDNVPVNASITNLDPTICNFTNTNFAFNQSNWNIPRQITVSAIKNGIYEPGFRECRILINLTSGEAPNGVSENFASAQPRFVLASFKAEKAALEYNNLSTTLVIRVLDADTLSQTGSVPAGLITGIGAFLLSTLGAILSWRAYRTLPKGK